MTLSNRNGGYVFLIRFKEFKLLQLFNDLSIRHLIELMLYENHLKLLKFKRSPP